MTDFTAWVEKNRGLWSRVYDEVIAPDFEKEWKKREEEHQNELKQREENQRPLFNHLNEQIVKSARLVKENERLEVRLQQRGESAAPSTALEETVIASADVPEEQHPALNGKYDELKKKNQDLSQKVKYLERKNDAVMRKNRDMKESVRAWQQYADRMKPNQRPKAAAAINETPSRLFADLQGNEAPLHMPSSPGSVSTVRTPLPLSNQERSSLAPDDILTDADNGPEMAAHEDGNLSPTASVTPRGPSTASSHEQQGAAHDTLSLNARLNKARQYQVEAKAVPSSSQTTVDEFADQVNRCTQVVDVEDEDDLPQVVSERSLKRKRGQKPRLDVYTGRSSDGTPAKPHRVKDEPLSSPPPAAHVLMRTETLDLDDAIPAGAEAAGTSQKTSALHSIATGTIRHQRSGSAPFLQVASRENVQKEQRRSDQLPHVPAKFQVATDDMRALSEPTSPHLEEQYILQTLDPNVVAQTPKRNSNKRAKQAALQHLKHGLLAESGEAPPPVDENELRLPPSAARARLQTIRATKDPQTPTNRLQRKPATGSPLVKQEQMPSPPKTASRLAQTASNASGSRRSAVKAHLNQQDEIMPDGRPVWSMRSSDKRSAPRKSKPRPSVGQQSRLRDKPVQELKAYDFKPNPVYNNGYTFAFSEAVRKRGDRLCLPGCTNEQCCGSHFRRLAEALGPLSAAEEDALLEEYLGDAYNKIMSTQMSSDERSEVVLQARTKKMAKASGKHREAYERRRSPPGFWRVDFPTTQELEVDRGRAKELEVKTVQERWLESHKEGGRWMFRDE